MKTVLMILLDIAGRVVYLLNDFSQKITKILIYFLETIVFVH